MSQTQMHWTVHLDGESGTDVSVPKIKLPATVAVDHKVYAFGGLCDKINRSQIYVNIFNTISLRWMKLAYVTKGNLSDIPPNRIGHTAVRIGDVIYLWGGLTELRCRCRRIHTCIYGYNCKDGVYGNGCNVLYGFRLDSHRWFKLQTSGAVPEARSGHSACVLGNAMYIYGGFDEWRDSELCLRARAQIDFDDCLSRLSDRKKMAEAGSTTDEMPQEIYETGINSPPGIAEPVVKPQQEVDDLEKQATDGEKELKKVHIEGKETPSISSAPPKPFADDASEDEDDNDVTEDEEKEYVLFAERLHFYGTRDPLPRGIPGCRPCAKQIEAEEYYETGNSPPGSPEPVVKPQEEVDEQEKQASDEEKELKVNIGGKETPSAPPKPSANNASEEEDNDYEEEEENVLNASQGMKILGKDLVKTVAGFSLLVEGREDKVCHGTGVRSESVERQSGHGRQPVREELLSRDQPREESQAGGVQVRTHD